MIPFYWGFREEDRPSKNDENHDAAWHREWPDGYNYRIDRDGAKDWWRFCETPRNRLPHTWAEGWEPQISQV